LSESGQSETLGKKAQQELLHGAQIGDIKAFQKLFALFQDALRAYLYRLLTNRNDVDDIFQDTFVRAFDKITTFKGHSSLKTWVFSIATNLARDLLRQKQRWPEDAQDQAKALASADAGIVAEFHRRHSESPQGAYEIREHIDFCFTCLAKTLPLEQQVALILKDVYGFSRSDLSLILDRSEGVVKHLLHGARATMQRIFAQRCALINKQGMCHQCTELANIFNPLQARQSELVKIEMVARANTARQEELYELRRRLIAAIDPLRSPGSDLQDVIMQCTRQAIGEIKNLAG
jgi:RNA polymerase sigma-70 factor (ECF subfamily)